MKKKSDSNNEKQLMKIEDTSLEKMGLEDTQLSEQLYNSAGLDPVVEAGLRDYDEQIKIENKLISKVLGPTANDIKGYGEAVAKRVSLAIYNLMNKQYGGKVGDLRSYIMALEDERSRANDKYDELMGRVVGILGNEYKELRTDSNAFMEKLVTLMGEDMEESKIDQAALAERLADIDGLREQIRTLTAEKAKIKEDSELQIAETKNTHNVEIAELSSRINELESQLKELGSANEALTADFTQLKNDYNELKTAITTVGETIPYAQIREELVNELYEYLLKDSKVPHMVIDGVSKFIDFRKYLGIAVEKGGGKVADYTGKVIGEVIKE